MKKINVIQYGLGEIGIACARIILFRPDLRLVAAVDPDPSLAGRDLADIIGLDRRLGMTVKENLSRVDLDLRGGVAIHTAGSRMETVVPQISELIDRGLNVVSAAEELLVPGLDRPDLARLLDRRARKRGATILGTGINPGFLMDYLPLVFAGIVFSIRRIKVARVVNASRRRRSLQAKIGSGISLAEFNRRRSVGAIGHVGLRHSVAFLAAGLGWELERIDDRLKPVIAGKNIRTEYFSAPRGSVAGIRETAQGIVNGKAAITLELRMELGADRPGDEILIEGRPPLRVSIPGGVDGDSATTAALVNTIPWVWSASPGLKTMRDLLPRLR